MTLSRLIIRVHVVSKSDNLHADLDSSPFIDKGPNENMEAPLV